MDVLVRVRCLTKFPMLQCPCGVVGAARLRRIPGQQCGLTSKVERSELTVVLVSHVFIHKTLGCGGAARWGRGRDRPFRH